MSWAPLATAFFTGHEQGGFYGVETTPRRMLSDALNARTPVPGLFLTGQDVMSQASPELPAVCLVRRRLIHVSFKN